MHELLQDCVLDPPRRVGPQTVDVRPLSERGQLGFLLAEVLQRGSAMSESHEVQSVKYTDLFIHLFNVLWPHGRCLDEAHLRVALFLLVTV